MPRSVSAPRVRPILIAAVVAALIVAVFALRPGSSSVEQAVAAPAVGEAGALVSYLRFAGSATVQAAPDRADLTVTTRVEAATTRAALAAAGARHRTVLAALRRLGIKAADLQTVSTSVEEERRKGRRFYAGIVATHVTVRDVDAVGRVVTAAAEAGAMTSGPSFSLENRRAAYDDALAKAIGDARSKAEATLPQIGGRSVTVVSVDDQPAVGPITMGADAVAEASAAGGATVPVEPGRITIEAYTVVTFSYER